jgi:DNA primase
MQLKHTRAYLRRIRNEVDIGDLIADVLDLPTKISEDYLRFLCPLCSEFNTAVNPSTNLARCFRCQKNFNPIDMVMTVKGYSFLEAVDFLSSLL